MAWWVKLVVVVGALLMASGALLALFNPSLLVSSGAEINAAAQVYAGYLVSRNLVLAAMLLAFLAMEARIPLKAMVFTTALVQFADAVIDVVDGRLLPIPAIVIIGTAFLLAARKLSNGPIWSVAGWRRDA